MSGVELEGVTLGVETPQFSKIFNCGAYGAAEIPLFCPFSRIFGGSRLRPLERDWGKLRPLNSGSGGGGRRLPQTDTFFRAKAPINGKIRENVRKWHFLPRAPKILRNVCVLVNITQCCEIWRFYYIIMHKMIKIRKNHTILDIFLNFDSATFFKNPDSNVTQPPVTPLNSTPDLCTIWQKLHLNTDFCFFYSLNFFFNEKKTIFKWNFVIILTLVLISTYLSNQINSFKNCVVSLFL